VCGPNADMYCEVGQNRGMIIDNIKQMLEKREG
jgi:hypothetical protein